MLKKRGKMQTPKKYLKQSLLFYKVYEKFWMIDA